MIKESFDEAKQFFQNFLSEQGLSSDLLWIFGEDIICLSKRLLIKVPLPAENESFAEVCYNVGRERDFGICLHAFCLLDERPCCYVWLPEDDLDAQYSLMGNLNLSAASATTLSTPNRLTAFWRGKRIA